MPIEPAITINFSELDKSPDEQYAGNGSPLQARMRIRCVWDDRLTLANQLIGGVQTIDGITTLTYSYLYPHDPNRVARLVAITNISPEGEPEANSLDGRFKQWKYAILSLSFGVDTTSYQSNRYNYKVNDTFGGYSEVVFVDTDNVFGDVKLHYGVTKTVDAVQTLTRISGEDPMRQVRGFRWVRVIDGLKDVSPDLVTYTGKVNTVTYQIPTDQFSPEISCPPETLMFESFDTSDVYDAKGKKLVKLTLNYIYKNLGAIKSPNVQPLDEVEFGGWNHVLPPGESEPVRLWITSSPTPDPLEMFQTYPVLDFTLIDDMYKSD